MEGRIGYEMLGDVPRLDILRCHLYLRIVLRRALPKAFVLRSFMSNSYEYNVYIRPINNLIQ